MRGILDLSSQRQIRIVEILAENDDWITYAQLSSALETSERTIAEDLSFLRTKWGHVLNFEVVKRNGIRLRHKNAASMSLVITEIFKESVALRWIKELLFHPKMPLDFYEKKTYVSRSTLLRQLPKINQFLKTRDMSIEYKNNQCEFLGKTEQGLRDFSAVFLLEIYGMDMEKFDLSLDLTIIYDLVLSALKKILEPQEFAFISEDDITLSYQTMFFLVSLIRESQGYHVASPYPVEEELEESGLAGLQQYFPLISMDHIRPVYESIHHHFNGWTSREEELFVIKELTDFLSRLFAELPTSPDEEQQGILRFILKSTYFKAALRPYESSALFDRIYYFFLSFKRKNPLLYELLDTNLAVLSKRVNRDLRSKIDMVAFWMCLVYPEISQNVRPKRALLIGDFGRLHSRFLAKSLSDFFNRETGEVLQFEIPDRPELLTPDELAEFDLLITTTPRLQVKHPNTVLIDDYPMNHNICDIHRTFFHHPDQD